MAQIKDKFLSIIEKSGNDFHLQVSNKLKELGWTVTDSQYYNDPDSDKAREIDIIAEKELMVSNSLKHGRKRLVFKLFIECKEINSPYVFWFRDKDKYKSIELAKDNFILKDKPDFYLNTREKHHYVNDDKVAWQWAQNNNDAFYDAQNKVLKAMIFFNERQDSDCCEISCPVIAVNNFDQVVRKEDGGGNKHLPIKESFQIETNYAYKNKEKESNTKYFLIDVVSYSLFEEFIKMLDENDIALLKGNLAFDLRHARIQKNKSDNNLDSYL